MQIGLSGLILKRRGLLALLREALRKLVAIVQLLDVYFSVCLNAKKAVRKLFLYGLSNSFFIVR